MPGVVHRPARLGADVVLRQDPAGREQQRELAVGPFVRGHIGRLDEVALAAHERVDVHRPGAARRRVVARPLDAAQLVELLERHARERRGEGGDLVHDLGLVRVRHLVAHRRRDLDRDLPLVLAGRRCHDGPDPVDPALGVGERPVLLEERGPGQEDVGVLGGLIEEQVLYDDQVHRHERGGHVLGVRVRLGQVLALDEDAPERAVDGRAEHVRDAQAGFRMDRRAPQVGEQLTYRRIGHVAVARQLMRERAHVARTLDVVLATQRADADAFAPDVAGRHGQVGHPHDHRRTLAVLGDAQAVVDRGVRGGGVQPGGGAQLGGRDAGDRLHRLGAVLRPGDERGPCLDVLAPLIDERLVHEPFGDDDVGHGVDDGHVRAGQELQVMAGLDVRAAHEVDPARVDDDELGALTQSPLHPRREDRVAVGGVGPDDDDDVRLGDRREILRAGRRAEGRLEAVAGRRMADPRAGVDVVRPERRADHLLDEVDLLVRAARRGDPADGARAVLGGDLREAPGRVGDGLVPGHFAPWLVDRVADHRIQHPVLVAGIAPREPALHAGMALVRAAVLVRDHVHDRVALQLGLERASDAAVRAGRQDTPVRRAELDERLLLEGVRRAGLDTGAAAHALGLEERLVLAGRHPRVEAATGDGQGERALDLVARSDAPGAHDALGRIECEVRVADVLGGILVAGLGLPVPDLGQADRVGQVVEFAAVAAAGPGQAVLRVVAEIQLHDAGPEALDLVRLGPDRHPVAAWGRARGGRPAPAVHLHDAQAARAERIQRVGRAQLGDLHAHGRGGAHDRGALGDVDVTAIHLDMDRGGTRTRLGPEVLLPDERHAWPPLVGAAAGRSKSSPKCRTALRTGIGVSPPIAHSEPSVMTSHRSSSRVRFA